MNGIEDQTPGCRGKTSNMFLEELTELVQMYLSKAEDRRNVVALLGATFVQTMKAEGVEVDDTLELVLDELDFQDKPPKNLPAKKPVLRLVQNN